MKDSFKYIILISSSLFFGLSLGIRVCKCKELHNSAINIYEEVIKYCKNETARDDIAAVAKICLPPDEVLELLNVTKIEDIEESDLQLSRLLEYGMYQVAIKVVRNIAGLKQKNDSQSYCFIHGEEEFLNGTKPSIEFVKKLWGITRSALDFKFNAKAYKNNMKKAEAFVLRNIQNISEILTTSIYGNWYLCKQDITPSIIYYLYNQMDQRIDKTVHALFGALQQQPCNHRFGIIYDTLFDE